MPIIAQIRDAVVDSLNHMPSMNPKILAEAAYDATTPIPNLSKKLQVVPREVSQDLFTHDNDEERELTIDVILRYKANTLTPTELDPYLALAESIGEYFIGRGRELIVGDVSFVCEQIRWPDGAFNQEQLEKNQILTIPLALSFRRVD